MIKKKLKFIIPASFFKDITIQKNNNATPQNKNTVKSIDKAPPPLSSNKIEQKNITTTTRRRSALSLSSLSQKTEEIKEVKDEQKVENLPTENFTKADFLVQWRKYIDILNKQRSNMLASILQSTEPTIVEQTTIKITYPNAMMMEEVKKNDVAILSYLRDKLQNYNLEFDLNYNEEIQKQFAYTPQEKYQKLLEHNPLLQEFKIKLSLDI